ncbi:MAG: radical SAM protein [Fluviicoccus sp.]|uniref:radical SAM protein n=1 Tax=Fluviicoccus sp. TaxID=2003552 RepID=UPI0027203DAB|nr:radical SAM protein [Fluviicoccus sp.]MDO8330586.1 radical SAM protein [Fluviicoccus sp.]
MVNASAPVPCTRVIVIETTTRCNLSCGFCAHDNRLALARRTHSADSLRQLVQVIGEHALNSGERILLSWLGGEPFLLKFLFGITEHARRKYPLSFSATTNGTRLHEAAIRRHIVEHYAEITVSVDGQADFHDRMRGRIGLFDSLRRGVQQLAQEAPDLKIRVNTVLMRENFAGFPELCHELAGWGVSEITVNPLGGRDRPEFFPGNRLTPDLADQLPDMVDSIRAALSHKTTQLIFTEGYLKRIQASVRDIRLPIGDCRPGAGYLFVSASGTISPCAFTAGEYGIAMESVLTPAAFAVLPDAFRSMRQSLRAQACGDCPCTNVHGKFS